MPRIRTQSRVLFVLAVALLAGCFGDQGTADDQNAGPLESHPTFAASERVLVSPPSHRVAEYSLARDPNDPDHLIAAAMDWDYPTGATPGPGIFVTFDGAQTWSAGGVIPGMDMAAYFADPWVSIDPQGRAHFTMFHTANGGAELWHARSDDGGLTWNPATFIVGGVDKPAVWASRDGRIHYCTLASSDLTVGMSLDGGATWTAPLKPGPAGGCNGIREGPAGELYVGWRGNGPGAANPIGLVGVLRSYDSGSTWEADALVDSEHHGTPYTPSGAASGGYEGVVIAEVLMPYEIGGPYVAVNPRTGHVFVSNSEYDETDLLKPHLFKSTDRGATFTEIPLPAMSGCGKCHAMKPTIAFDDAGHLGFQVDLSFDDAQTQREVRFLISLDEGLSWQEPIVLSSTDLAHSWVDPGFWVGSQEHAEGLVAYYSDHPEEAAGAATPLAADYGKGRQRRFGGEYGAITGLDDGFLALWIDSSQDGLPKLWSSSVAPGGTAGDGKPNQGANMVDGRSA